MKFDRISVENTHEWYLVQLRPNFGNIAERNLLRQGFHVFSPRLRRKRYQKGRYRETKAPLFPGYVFVGFNPAVAPWRAINSTYGVCRLVTFGSAYPRAVPTGLVDNLRLRCDENGNFRPTGDFKAGDEVRVTSGPFAEFMSRVERLDEEGRVWLLLDIMGRKTQVGLSPGDIIKLQSDAV